MKLFSWFRMKAKPTKQAYPQRSPVRPKLTVMEGHCLKLLIEEFTVWRGDGPRKLKEEVANACFDGRKQDVYAAMRGLKKLSAAVWEVTPREDNPKEPQNEK